MWLGIDIGTSSVKALLLDRDGAIAAQAEASLAVSRPQPLWSEQNPDDWWTATESAVLGLPQTLRKEVRGIGISGQMHGATVLGADDEVLRPAILWNDGRSFVQCEELMRRIPGATAITANLVMPGFTAPKLLWIAEHEPEVFAATQTVLLPKDFVRLRMTGDKASDMGDAAGTSWLDIAERRWSDAMLDATGLSEDHMPTLYEGCEPTGTLRAAVANRWDMDAVPVAAGAGDNAASAIGLGAFDPGDAFVSLGTSGVFFVADEMPRPNPDAAVHCYCHALPERWHRMGVILSAAATLDWAARFGGFANAGDALGAAGKAKAGPYFLPHLSGERTPHNDAEATGAFIGITADTDPADLLRATLEGVAFALAECQSALDEAGETVVHLVGGGSRSDLWAQMIADALRRPVAQVDGGHAGAALGAARLGALAAGAPCDAILTKPARGNVFEPKTDLSDRFAAWSRLYPALKEARL
ncbi:xylulokinase [Parasphingopyxis algicola]|uniref:xylulokinase n=1 Tax=Parasphingopyxis algicola TaxID=2026624 RepID=UPI0015A36C77|nr:xylulokinase [Parasphingopyxis algicola]QLC24744.1 xylulokinase [Parasphingopyxis algicola]